MPTLRLSDNDKTNITTEFDIVLNKARHNHVFPLDKDELQNLFVDSFPVNIASAYREIYQWKSSLLRTGGYCAYMTLSDEVDGTYKIIIIDATSLPDVEPHFVGGSKWYPELLKWATESHDTDKKIFEAQRYVSKAVDNCTSAGQILRVLPEDCVKFLPPKVTSTFSQAERRSRIPRDFTPNPEKAELVLNMLALGSISPDHKGLNAEVSSYIEPPDKP
jgi:hypothetical protein